MSSTARTETHDACFRLGLHRLQEMRKFRLQLKEYLHTVSCKNKQNMAMDPYQVIDIKNHDYRQTFLLRNKIRNSEPRFRQKS